MNQSFRTLSLGFLLAVTLVLPGSVQAQAAPPNQGPCIGSDPSALIHLPNFKRPDCQTAEVVVNFLREIVNVALMFVLSVALIFLIITGYQFVTAGGNKEAMARAKTSLLYITLGVLAVLSAYMIVKFVSLQFINFNPPSVKS